MSPRQQTEFKEVAKLQAFLNYRDELTVSRGLILKGQKIFVNNKDGKF